MPIPIDFLLSQCLENRLIFKIDVYFPFLKVTFEAVGHKSNKRKALTYRAFRLFVWWVAGGTRTHDIQNHNLTL